MKRGKDMLDVKSMEVFSKSSETIDYLFMNKDEVVATFSLQLGVIPRICG